MLGIFSFSRKQTEHKKCHPFYWSHSWDAAELEFELEVLTGRPGTPATAEAMTDERKGRDP